MGNRYLDSYTMSIRYGPRAATRTTFVLADQVITEMSYHPRLMVRGQLIDIGWDIETELASVRNLREWKYKKSSDIREHIKQNGYL